MNKKSIGKSLNIKLNDWLNHIEDKDIKRIIKENAIITGGAIVSLLNNEVPNDYDIYFKTQESCLKVAEYYANVWNKSHSDIYIIVTVDDNGCIECRLNKQKVLNGEIRVEDIENMKDTIDDDTEPYVSENPEEPTKENPEISKPKYRPRYFTTNAISLSDKIQLIIRFYGPVEEIHTNYDFEHCKCSYDFQTNKVELPNLSLECIINKELVYNGSKYPLCSIIRTRKYISRGWTINAGQYVKMCLDLNELDLLDISVLKDQLVGVDSLYFSVVIDYIEKRHLKEPEWTVDNRYLFEVINRIF